MLPDPDIFTVKLAIAAAIAILAGLMRGFAGFGSVMMTAPPYAILFGPLEMIGVISLMEFAANFQLVPGALRDVEWRFVRPLAIGAALGMPLGSAILLNADTDMLTRAIAIIVIVFVGVLMTGWRYTGEKKPAVALGLGAISGGMMTTTAIGGPPVLLYMLSGPDAAYRNRANIIVYFGITGVLMLGVLFAIDIIHWSTFWRAVVLTPAFVGATWLGTRMFRKSSEKLYRRVALVVLLCIGVISLLN